LGQFKLGVANPAYGRSDLISQLKRLAGRGWSAIAIVGRRGVGKSRVLYELLRSHQGSDERPSAVVTWISAPSQFAESEFIESVLERLTISVENTIARHLDAKPIEVRRLETKYTLIGIGVYFAIMFVAFWTYTLATTWSRLIDNNYIWAFVPVLLGVVASLVILVRHLTQIQPVDLSPWLERDRSNSPHTVLLYREALQVRDFLNRRRSAQEKTVSRLQLLETARIVLIIGLVLTVVALVLLFLTNTQTYMTPEFFLFLLPACLLLLTLVFVRGRSLRMEPSQGLMTLISEYREFAEKTVYRIRNAALGKREEDKFEIVICIDELDKIVEIDELRAFLRRMKAIFEIPGVYYYLSLSEDGLRALVLGPAMGKNEVDSAFDHILRVPALDNETGARIAQEYLQNRGIVPQDSRLFLVIAATSFGVPRDIIRRCDELLSSQQGANTRPADVSDNLRIRQAQLAYEGSLLTREEYNEVSGDPNAAARFLESNVTIGLDKEIRAIMLSLWVLSLISLVVQSERPDQSATLEQLRNIGYRISEAYAEDLIDELRELQSKMLGQN
jgi:hypothetical protein